MPEGIPGVLIAVTRAELTALAERAGQAPRVALDLEANGRFAYRARVSTLQLGWGDEVALVDPLSPELDGHLEALQPLFSSQGPVKVIHDVGFDARLLADVGLTLGNVHDTALMAQWLGRPATGLASLALSELGVTLDKSLQAQDWAARPLTERSLRYLADDVAHLLALDDRLWAETVQADIVAEVLEETAYRLASAERAISEPDARPPFVRVKGAEKLPRDELVILRRVAEARESEAKRLDTPAGELVPTAVLLAIAHAKPTTAAALARIRRPIARIDPERVGQALLLAVLEGQKDGALSPEDAAWFEHPKLPPGVIKARRDRESRLSAWRKAESTARGVHEQVILPGHCASEIVGASPSDARALASVGGIGAFRVARYGEAILKCLEEPPPP
jgi:ribonuclease D